MSQISLHAEKTCKQHNETALNPKKYCTVTAQMCDLMTLFPTELRTLVMKITVSNTAQALLPAI